MNKVYKLSLLVTLIGMLLILTGCGKKLTKLKKEDYDGVTGIQLLEKVQMDGNVDLSNLEFFCTKESQMPSGNYLMQYIKAHFDENNNVTDIKLESFSTVSTSNFDESDVAVNDENNTLDKLLKLSKSLDYTCGLIFIDEE